MKIVIICEGYLAERKLFPAIIRNPMEKSHRNQSETNFRIALQKCHPWWTLYAHCSFTGQPSASSTGGQGGCQIQIFYHEGERVDPLQAPFLEIFF